jgi:hypothetical protein
MLGEVNDLLLISLEKEFSARKDFDYVDDNIYSTGSTTTSS